MIEVISSTRCTGCNICVTACPANVFDPVPGGLPVIARQDDCQTCFLCEIYCPVDALFVSPMADGPAAPGEVSESSVEARGLFGSYAREMGWKRGRAGGADGDPTFKIRAFL